MTTRRPPPGRPPGLEPYRPSEELGAPPQRPHGATQRPDAPPSGWGGPPRRAEPRFEAEPRYAAQGPHAQGYPAHPQPGPPRGVDASRHYDAPLSAAPRDPYSERGPRRAAPPSSGPPRRKGSGFGSIVFYSVLGLLAMAAGAAAFAIAALPADFVRDRVVAAVKERTGRDLVIAGPATFTVYPSVGISLADVSLSGGPGFEGAKPLVAMQALDVSVALWPLIQREVRVSTLALRNPVFNLEVDNAGRRSWDFAAADDAGARVRLAQAAPSALSDAEPASPRARRSMLRVQDLQLDDVRIDNGTLTYSDRRTDQASEFSAINARMTLAALTAPLNAEGTLDWKGQTVRFEGALTSLAEVMERRPAKLDLTLGAGVLDATFEGSTTLADALFAEGILTAKSQSARNLFRWFGTELPPSRGFGALNARGLLRGTPGQVSFSTAEIVLDDTTARGDISLDTKGARPLVTANLQLTALDLNLYSSDGNAPAAPGGGGAAAPSPRGEASGKAQSIEDLLREAAPPPGPRVQGYTKRAGWSDEPFALDALGALDANAKLSIAKLKVGTLGLDKSDLTVTLKNRVMKTALDDVRLYGGTGRGTITFDGTAGSQASLGANLTLDGVSAQPLLTDAAEIDRLTGTGRLAFALAGQGASERQIVETLNGKVELAFRDGAIVGINVAEMLRNLSKGNLKGLDTAPTDKTDFSEMTSTWTVTSGIAENQDLKLVSPLLRVGGAGRVALPAREVDYVLRPKVVASLAGQGDRQNLDGLEVPVRVHGPWEDPKFTPDLAGVLQNPNAVETIKEIGKQFKGKNADEIVNDLFGGEGGDGESTKAKGKKLLEQFLGR